MGKIIITGAAGFIGSCLAGKLNNKGFTDLVLVDDFSRSDKLKNHANKACAERVDRGSFLSWLDVHSKEVDFVFHIGARTDTTETDQAVFDNLNLNYTKALWTRCVAGAIPMIYASSAATYGIGDLGYSDDHGLVASFSPLNLYGKSKNDFDLWALSGDDAPPFWAGMKFFNVYGPNEFHKGRMASVIFHAYHQVRGHGTARLFRSHRPDYKDGEQLRDFVYVKDVVDVLFFLMRTRPASGLYNLGTGRARSFLDLARAVFRAVDVPERIDFVDTPEDIRDKYQYFTEADIRKLRNAGYEAEFYSLEEGVEEYVQEFLKSGRYF